MNTEMLRDQQNQFDEERRSLTGRVAGATRRYFYAGVGVVSVGLQKASDFRHETVEKGIDRLAERGLEVKDRRWGQVNETTEATRGVAVGVTKSVAGMTGATIDSVAKAARERLNLASSDDIDSVARQLDDLTRQIETIEQPPAN
jgi:hypothetical protein